jgi:hypothetical protein
MDYGFGPYDKLPPFTENTVVELTVPSGQLIVSDSLRGTKYFDVEPPLSINYGLGTHAWALEYAAKCNLGYAFVGNTSPSIVKHEDGHLEVVSLDWDAKDVHDENVVAGICTDLWATMITDYQNWLDNGGRDITEEGANKYGSYTLIDVEPGKYQWIVYSHKDGFDTWDEERITYAELTRIGDIDG